MSAGSAIFDVGGEGQKQDQTPALGGPNETSFISQRSKSMFSQTLEVSNQALKDQIKFMSEKLQRAMKDLEEKELLVEQIELDKREAYRKYDAMEQLNFEFQERLTVAQVEAETAKKESQQLTVTMSNVNQ